MSFTQNTMIDFVVFPFALCRPSYGFNQRSCALTTVAIISHDSLTRVKVITCSVFEIVQLCVHVAFRLNKLFPVRDQYMSITARYFQ